MTTKEFELKLKELDERFSIYEFPPKQEKSDINAIKFMNLTIGAIPSNNIYEERNEAYRDANGMVHRTVGEALFIAQVFLDKWNENAFDETTQCTFQELMTEAL